jgi:hypothetical protein
MLTVYKPSVPLPDSTDVTTVPGVTPSPTTGEPTARVPDTTLVTVSWVPDIEPTKDAPATAPIALVSETTWEEGTDTVYVPAPPVPDPKPVTTVPGATRTPVTGMPTVTAPEATELTLIEEPVMLAENNAVVGAPPAATNVLGTV